MSRFSIIALLIGILAVGCVEIFNSGPTVCDTVQGNSVLCTMSDKHGVKLETIGNVLIVANRTAIAAGAYSKSDALKALVEIRKLIDSPVSYAFFTTEVRRVSKKYPGLIQIAEKYLSDLIEDKIMFKADREILQKFLDSRIKSLTEWPG